MQAKQNCGNQGHGCINSKVNSSQGINEWELVSLRTKGEG